VHGAEATGNRDAAQLWQKKNELGINKAQQLNLTQHG
jgi:hypothetical protein